jgi:hypothetical protein
MTLTMKGRIGPISAADFKPLLMAGIARPASAEIPGRGVHWELKWQSGELQGMNAISCPPSL